MHGLLLATVLPFGWPPWLVVAAGAAVLTHAVWRRPSATCPELVVRPGGLWSIPAEGLDQVSIGPRTRYTRYWVRLELRGTTGSRVLVLTRDQLDPAAWRKLQAALRRAPDADGASDPKDRQTVLR